MEGLQIDLDCGQGQIMSGLISDDIQNPCTWLSIHIECEKQLAFQPDDSAYFRYLSHEWIPVTNEFGYTSLGTYWYKLEAIPKQMFKIIDKPCVDMQSLAIAMGMELTDDSTNFPIKCPIIGLPAYAFIKKIREQSFNDAAVDKDMGKAFFVYCNSKSLTSISWDKMLSSKANSLQIPDELKTSEEINGFDGRILDYLNTPQRPVKWSEQDFLKMMGGITITMKTLQPAFFAQMYTVKFDNTNEMDSPAPMLCFASDCDITNMNQLTNKFAVINLK